MGTIEYDSTKPAADINNPQAKMMVGMYKAMMGQNFVMKLTPKGKVLAIEGFDEMMAKMMDAMGIDDPNAAGAMKEMMKNFMSEDRLKDMGNEMMTGFPEEPVGIGDVWHDIVSLGDGLPIDLDVTYMLKERKDGVVVVDLVSKIDMGDEDSSLIENVWYEDEFAA